MKKRKVFIIIVLGLFYCISNVSFAYLNKDLVVFEDQSLSSKGIFNLNYSKNDICNQIKRNKIEIVREDKHGNEGSVIICNGIELYFNANNKLTEINVYQNFYRTFKGLIVGDSLKKVIKLYGLNYKIHDEPGVTVYQYSYKENFFSVVINDKKIVDGWVCSLKNL